MMLIRSILSIPSRQLLIRRFSASAVEAVEGSKEATTSLVKVSRCEKDIVTVTLNNPKKHNSLTFEMVS